MVSSNASGGMEYYRFEDILQQKEKAEYVFRDRVHNEYYQSHGIFQRKGDSMTFRTMLYTSLKVREYALMRSTDPLKKGKLVRDKLNSVETIYNLADGITNTAFASPVLSKDGTYMAA